MSPFELRFDAAWYLESYPQLQSQIGADRPWSSAQAHYDRQGAREGLSPNAFFDEGWYRQANPDVLAAIEAGQIPSGYSHYKSSGGYEGRSPNGWFNERWYRSTYPEIAEAIRLGSLTCAYQHYLADGFREGRMPNAAASEAGRRAQGKRTPYEEWIEDSMLRRQHQYPARHEPGLISLVTSAYNTPVEFLRVLANSVIEQDFGAGTVFEWVLVDNGSTDPATVAELRALAQHDTVRFYRVEHNLGIMGGMRFGVQRATGRYIVPVDSDDYVRPDAVRILAWTIQTHGYPALLYSDEDKIENGVYFEAYFKPAWDPVLFFHSCYIAHLCAIDRGLAVVLGAYSDESSKGCHDWDTFTRFYLAGYEPLHVPEVLYSWRRHSASCAGDIMSKDYIHSSHLNTLQKFLDASAAPERYQITYSPLFQRSPDWRFERNSGAFPHLLTVILAEPGDEVNLDAYYRDENCEVAVLDVESTLESVSVLLRNHRAEQGLVRIVSSAAKPLFEDWFSEAVTFFELFPDTAIIGGPIYDYAERTLTGSIYFGFGGACGSPDRMRARQDPGYFVQMWKPHSVSAVSAQHLIVDGSFLLDALASGRIPREIPLSCLGEWLGAVAARWQKRVVYSPFLGVRSTVDWQSQSRWTPTEQGRFAFANGDFIPDLRFYSQHFGLSLESAYLPIRQERGAAASFVAGHNLLARGAA